MVANLNDVSMELDLFSFDFSDAVVSEAMIQDALQTVIARAKQEGNHHSFHVYKQKPGRNRLSQNVINLLPDLEQCGYLKLWDGGRMCELNNALKDWHNPEEIAQAYRDSARAYLENGKTFYDLFSIYTNVSGPGIRQAVEEARIELAIGLGLDHMKKYPAALGHKMNLLKRHNKAALQAIHEGTKAIKDWKGIRSYFESVAFEQPCKYKKGEIEYVTLSPYLFAMVCLAQTEDFDDVVSITAYMGGSWVSAETDLQIIPYENVGLITIEEDTEEDTEEDFGDEDDEFDECEEGYEVA